MHESERELAGGTLRNRVANADERMTRWFDSWNPYDPDKVDDRGLAPVEIEESSVRKGATRAILAAVALFLVWSVTMPLDAGVTLQGDVIPSGYRKSVQHQTGGVVRTIMVQEGSRVQAGQILIRMNQLASAAGAASVEQQFIEALAGISRLKAEQAGAGAIRWEEELAGLNPLEVAEAKASQQQLFAARRMQMSQQLAGLSAQQNGLQSAIRAHREQLGTLTEEYAKVAELAKDGFVPKAQVNSTLRNRADQESALASAQAESGKIQAQMAELRSRQLSENAKELSELISKQAALRTQLAAAQFEQASSDIRAPVSGTVVNLKVFTEGGVVSAGETLMEIVPEKGRLVIEARVSPKAIDRVRAGSAVDIRFPSFNQSTTPVIEGIVRSVGVDKLKSTPGEETKQEEDYYLALIDTTEEGMAKISGKELRPGLPADIIVKTGKRTFMSYLLKPLTDKFALSFKD